MLNKFYRWLGDVTYKASRSRHIKMYSRTFYFFVAICQWSGVQANKPYIRHLQETGQVWHYHKDGRQCKDWSRKHLREMRQNNDYENI